MDEWGFGTSFASAQATASGTVLVDRGNQSGRLVAPSGITRGIPFNSNGLGGDANISGRLSLGFLQLIVVFLVLSYVWTRNVQGGG